MTDLTALVRENIGQARLLIDTGFSQFGETVNYSPLVTIKALDLLDRAIAAIEALERAAEQRGREAGLREAAAVAEKTGTCLLPSGHFLSERCRDAILALITKEASHDRA